MTEEFKHYLAGYIDADGCISLSKVRKHLKPTVAITGTHKWILDEMQVEIGFGKVYSSKRSNPKWRTIYYLKFTTQEDIKKLLGHIWDKLKLKQLQAGIMLSFLGSPDARGLYDFWHSEMKKLNKKGN